MWQVYYLRTNFSERRIIWDQLFEIWDVIFISNSRMFCTGSQIWEVLFKIWERKNCWTVWFETSKIFWTHYLSDSFSKLPWKTRKIKKTRVRCRWIITTQEIKQTTVSLGFQYIVVTAYKRQTIARRLDDGITTNVRQ